MKRFKNVEKKNQLRAIGIFVSAMLIVLFQNCQPFEGTTAGTQLGSSDGSSTGDPVAPPPNSDDSNSDPDPTPPPVLPPPPPETPKVMLPNEKAPLIVDWPGNQMIQVGLSGNLSGTVPARNLKLKAHGGQGEEHQPITLICDSSDNRLDVDCGAFNGDTATISVGPDNDNECFSGEATISLKVRDREPSNSDAPELESDTKTFRVQIANSCPDEQKVYGGTMKSQDNFGEFVAIDGNYAVVAAVGDDEAGGDTGAAHIYRFNNGSWTFMQKLVLNDAENSNKAGPVDIRGGKIIIGNPLRSEGAGAAYIFELNNNQWVQTAALSPGANLSSTEKDMFGASVSLVGDWAAIGSYQYTSGNVFGAGTVYLYQKVSGTWQLRQQLFSPSPANFEEFGFSLDIEPGHLAVGAPADNSAGQGNGAVYTYRLANGQWDYEAAATTNGKEGAGVKSRFGYSVDLDGDGLLVGAPKAKGRRDNSGAAYLFTFNKVWELSQKLQSSDGDNGDEFGGDVALDGASAVISARLEQPNNLARAGSAYHFALEGDKYKQVFKLMSRDRSERDFFGSSVALDGDLTLIGSRLDDGKPDEFLDGVGSAYFIKLK